MKPHSKLHLSRNQKEREFIRGQNFAFILELPCSIPPSALADWNLSCQLRRREQAGPDGLIAQIDCAWVENMEGSEIQFDHPDTEAWPLGPAEFDVLFVDPVSGRKVRSLPIRLRIVPGVTQ